MTDDIITKFCGGCKKNLPTSGFSKNRRTKDGLQAKCKGCIKASSRAYREANRAKLAEKQKAYYATNREKAQEYSRAYYAANREKAKEGQKAWREANREKLTEYQKAYRAANPEKLRAKEHNRRARKRNAQGSHTAEQVSARFAVHGDACIYCSSTENLHADHLKPLAKGGSNWASNIVPACSSCNTSKSDRWGEELRSWIRTYCTVPGTRRRLG